MEVDDSGSQKQAIHHGLAPEGPPPLHHEPYSNWDQLSTGIREAILNRLDEGSLRALMGCSRASARDVFTYVVQSHLRVQLHLKLTGGCERWQALRHVISWVPKLALRIGDTAYREPCTGLLQSQLPIPGLQFPNVSEIEFVDTVLPSLAPTALTDACPNVTSLLVDSCSLLPDITPNAKDMQGTATCNGVWRNVTHVRMLDFDPGAAAGQTMASKARQVEALHLALPSVRELHIEINPVQCCTLLLKAFAPALRMLTTEGWLVECVPHAPHLTSLTLLRVPRSGELDYDRLERVKQPSLLRLPATLEHLDIGISVPPGAWASLMALPRLTDRLTYRCKRLHSMDVGVTNLPTHTLTQPIQWVDSDHDPDDTQGLILMVSTWDTIIQEVQTALQRCGGVVCHATEITYHFADATVVRPPQARATDLLLRLAPFPRFPPDAPASGVMTDYAAPTPELVAALAAMHTPAAVRKLGFYSLKPTPPGHPGPVPRVLRAWYDCACNTDVWASAFHHFPGLEELRMNWWFTRDHILARVLTRVIQAWAATPRRPLQLSLACCRDVEPNTRALARALRAQPLPAGVRVLVPAGATGQRQAHLHVHIQITPLQDSTAPAVVELTAGAAAPGQEEAPSPGDGPGLGGDTGQAGEPVAADEFRGSGEEEEEEEHDSGEGETDSEDWLWGTPRPVNGRL